MQRKTGRISKRLSTPHLGGDGYDSTTEHQNFDWGEISLSHSKSSTNSSCKLSGLIRKGILHVLTIKGGNAERK